MYRAYFFRLEVGFMIPLLLLTLNIKAQNFQYFKSIFIADSLQYRKNFRAAGRYYSHAINNSSLIIEQDYLNAIISYAKANDRDIAFKYLDLLAKKGNYKDFVSLNEDKGLVSLKSDPRWGTVIAKVQANQKEAEKHYNLKLKQILDQIYEDDQAHRRLLNETIKRYGVQSDQVGDLENKMGKDDAKNFLKVSQILDKYGWLGSQSVGERGAKALYLTIQHTDSDPDAQVKYAKMFKKAIKSGLSDEKADYAYLQDRISLFLHHYQIYGSQLRLQKNGVFIAQPIINEQHVDERRISVGLPPLKYYLSSVNQYK